jgi:hypothetical protein
MRQDDDEKKEVKPVVSLKKAGELTFHTPQSLLMAIKNHRVKGEKIKGKWVIDLQSLEEYLENRWSRTFSKFNGVAFFVIYKK